MDATERSRRASALYYDNDGMTRRVLCERVVLLEDVVSRTMRLLHGDADPVAVRMVESDVRLLGLCEEG